MAYYDTIAEDLKRVREILERGRAEPLVINIDDPHGEIDAELKAKFQSLAGGTIYGADIYAAYKLLESLADEVERLQHRDLRLTEELIAAHKSEDVAGEHWREALDEVERLQEVEHKLGIAATTLGQQWKEVAAKLDAARELLRRIYGWDMMDANEADGPYWRSEINKVLSS